MRPAFRLSRAKTPGSPPARTGSGSPRQAPGRGRSRQHGASGSSSWRYLRPARQASKRRSRPDMGKVEQNQATDVECARQTANAGKVPTSIPSRGSRKLYGQEAFRRLTDNVTTQYRAGYDSETIGSIHCQMAFRCENNQHSRAERGGRSCIRAFLKNWKPVSDQRRRNRASKTIPVTTIAA